MGWTHRHYTRRINFRERVRGHLFQERFHSFPVQTDQHLLAVSRYVERNPVRTKLVSRAEAYPWSSARHHVLGVPDPLVSASPLLAMVPAWGTFLEEGDVDVKRLRQHMRSSRPFGTEAWVQTLEDQFGRSLRPRRGGWPRGRPRKLVGMQP